VSTWKDQMVSRWENTKEAVFRRGKKLAPLCHSTTTVRLIERGDGADALVWECACADARKKKKRKNTGGT